MATHRQPLIGYGTLPDTSGNMFFEPASVKLSNDLYGGHVGIFKDSGTKVSLKCRITVPENYVGTPVIVADIAANATTGNVVLDVDYRAIADGESYDPSTHQESVTATVTMPGTAFLRKRATLSLTGSNLAPGDTLEVLFSRDGAQAADTLAADLMLFDLTFEYADA